VRVTGHDLSRLAVLLGSISIRALLDIPDNERVVSGTRKEEFLLAILILLGTGLEAVDPTVVTLKVTGIRKSELSSVVLV